MDGHLHPQSSCLADAVAYNILGSFAKTHLLKRDGPTKGKRRPSEHVKEAEAGRNICSLQGQKSGPEEGRVLMDLFAQGPKT